VLIDAAQVSHFVANNSDNDGKGEEGNTRFCLWDVPPRIAEEHQFIGDEEVFEYRLCHQLSSPGYLIKNKPLFKLTPLDKSSCCFDFKYFWRLWVSSATKIGDIYNETLRMTALSQSSQKATPSMYFLPYQAGDSVVPGPYTMNLQL